LTEIDIIRGCKAQKPKAYKALVDTYSNHLFSVCKRYVGNSVLAQDCLQESLVQIIQKIDLYEERGKFKSWMSTVTVKKCLDILRKEKRHRSADMEFIVEPGVDENVSFELEMKDVLTFLDTIPSQYRIAINMFLIEGYSHKEIGDHLEISESSSRSLVSRGRKMIVEAFKKREIKVSYINTDRKRNRDLKIVRG